MLKDVEFGYEYYELFATSEQIQISKDFAPKYAESVYEEYAKRGQSDLQTIIDQAISSKIFEFMVYNHLTQYGKCTQPDVAIYPPGRKSFSADLTYQDENGTLKIHVKSQDISRIRSLDWISWGFQTRDKLLTKPQSNDWLLTGIIISPTKGHLLIQKPADELVHLTRGAKIARVAPTKQFLYYEDLSGLQPLD